MRQLVIIILVVGLTQLITCGQKTNGLKINGKNIVFDDGYVFQTNIFNLGYVGQLRTSKKKPFLILTGVQCEACDASISIYIVSPSDGPLKIEGEQTRYGLPGRLRDYETNELIYEGKAFWGEVLPKRVGVIWFQKELNDKKEWIESTFLAELKNDSIKEELIRVDIKTTLAQLDKKLAWEIKGGDMTSEP